MKMRTVAILGVTSAVVIAIIVAVCTTVVTGAPSSKDEGYPRKAIVLFNVGVDSSGVEGFLELTQEGSSEAVRINGTLKGLKPEGKHGFHVHQSGDIRNGCASTKGHFNPQQVNHGAPSDSTRHVGDLGNIEAASDGTAVIDITDKIISLNGDNSIIGRAFVVHEKTDDLGKGGDEGSLKTGNAGSRLACGIIAIL